MSLLRRDRHSTSNHLGEWPGWLGVAAVVAAYAAAATLWGDVAGQVFVVLVAAVSGAFVGFWLAAEWTNVDDREMAGDPFPVVAVAVSTVVGALAVGGLALLGALWWG
jgi:hypothetical protein